jgi:hypothetical protein
MPYECEGYCQLEAPSHAPDLPSLACNLRIYFWPDCIGMNNLLPSARVGNIEAIQYSTHDCCRMFDRIGISATSDSVVKLSCKTMTKPAFSGAKKHVGFRLTRLTPLDLDDKKAGGSLDHQITLLELHTHTSLPFLSPTRQTQLPTPID